MSGRAMPSKPHYSFPILDAVDILECMKELKVDLSEEELNSPTPELITRVFESLLEVCMGIAKEELNQPKFSGLGALSFPELHEESIPKLSLFRAT